MKLLSHPNLVKLLAVCTTGEPVYIVMELMIHGENRLKPKMPVIASSICCSQDFKPKNELNQNPR